MILLLGASGYFGRAFGAELRWRGYDFIPLSRRALDYTRFEVLFDFVRRRRPEFIINAAGWNGSGNTDLAAAARAEYLAANVILPQTIARVALMTNTAWGHVSAGAIYAGAKVIADGRIRIERDLSRLELRELFAARPECFFGFTEWDAPNFTFRDAAHNFFSGTKALAEEVIRGQTRAYVWRPGIPFDDRPEAGNALAQPPAAGIASLTHVGDFVRACLNLWERQAAAGTYNIVNPGAVVLEELAGRCGRMAAPVVPAARWNRGAEFYHCAGKAVRSHSLLDAAKLRAAGGKLRPVAEALAETLERWRGTPALAVA